METMLGVVIALLTLCCGCFRAGYVLGKDIGSKQTKKCKKIDASCKVGCYF